MPDEYKGATKDKPFYAKTSPRMWTEKEIEWCQDLRAEGYSYSDIAISVGRSEPSVSIKLKRLRKSNGTYNSSHVSEKHAINDNFLSIVKPKTILDLYSGAISCYGNYDADVTTNDINPRFKTDYNMDAYKCLCLLYAHDYAFDLIDLDSFGSSSDCFDLAIKMAKKGLIVTYGEIGHKRWKRLDYVSRHYGIDSLDDFNIYRLIDETNKIANRNKKRLVPYEVKNWNNISRVWYLIEDVKITEQWSDEK